MNSIRTTCKLETCLKTNDGDWLFGMKVIESHLQLELLDQPGDLTGNISIVLR